MRAAAALVALAAALLPAPVRAERLVLSLSSNQVAIGSNYTGTQLVLYGIIERDAQSVSRAGALEIVATVRGPREALTVRQKEMLGPVWLNRSQRKFVAVPAVLAVLSSSPLAEIASEPFRSRFRLGLNEIVDAPEFTVDRGADDPFRAALVRLKRRDGLWSENERGIVFVTPAFFRGRLSLPATAPTGNYDIEVVLLSENLVLSRRNVSFEVVKSGFEEQITAAAQEHALGYGLVAAAIALAFGWLASVIFRRD